MNHYAAREAQTDDLAGLLALFAAAGGGCYCQWWHFSGDDYAWQQRCAQDSQTNRSAFEQDFAAMIGKAAEGRAALGVVATDEHGRTLGWLKLCRAASAPKIYARRLYRTLDCFTGDREQTWVIACMLTHPEHRREGVARALVVGAIESARRAGGSEIEALARLPEEPTEDAVLAMGPASLLGRMGFVHTAGPERYPIMRLSL
jgi:GNAT superfamily N-acetyltransferase